MLLLVYSLILLFIVVFFIKVLQKPTIIKFRVNSLDWFIPIFVIYIIFFIIFFAEAIFNFCLQQVEFESKIIWIILKLMDGGMLIPVITAILSSIFGKLVEIKDLDLSEIYSTGLSKVVFSWIIVIHSFCFGYVVITSGSMDIFSQSVLNRIVAWLVTFIGIWFSVGSNCEGRIRRYKKNVTDSKRKLNTFDALKYYAGFFCTLVLIGFFYIVCFLKINQAEKLVNDITKNVWIVAIEVIVALFIINYITMPSQNRSDIILKGAIRHHEKEINDKRKYRYKNILYNIRDNSEEYELVIFERHVIYNGREAEVENIFGKKVYKIKGVEFGEIREILDNVVRDRNDYLREQFEKCRINRKTELEKSDCI